jgi:hypothetical protein
MRALVLIALVGCRARVIDLGTPDAATDAPRDAPADASTCVCRIMPCRLTADCALTGGTCGADFYCTGDFGPCATSATCQATSASSVCTTSATSIAACP